MKRILISAAAVAIMITIAACGTKAVSGATSTTGTATVNGKSINGQTVLVDKSGMALYANDKEQTGMLACNGACTSIWIPLTVDKGSKPTETGVSGKLGVITRSDGSRQVTFNGEPVYTFYLDHAGQVTGDGFHDAFSGQSFVWHVERSGAATAAGGGSGGTLNTAQTSGATSRY
jgi:predicted lipoprotein with Yx(FWY)xxD motif